MNNTLINSVKEILAIIKSFFIKGYTATVKPV